ncbi:MAG TPA: hypothetical protein VNM92_01630 [Thermoanaerobaculia bacterium]|nr:hypothetical protein [Thermoanaerobaculia bacterium]
MNLEGLPGFELIRQGLEDLGAQRESASSLLILIGAPRLRRIGLTVDSSRETFPEHRLYEILSLEDSDSAHSRYNAFVRQLVSFERAAECAF